MTTAEESSPSATYEDWNEGLLDALLPVLPAERMGSPVLLACDEEMLALVGAEFGFPPAGSVERFGALVERRYRLATDGGTEKARRSALEFNKSPDRARRSPPFLGVCAVMVLAASRMTSAEGMSTSNYYQRLWETLGTQPRRRPPYEFDYAPHLFKHLARWLEQDLDGARGLLVLDESGPSYIGCAINQCLFRQRDKEHLYDFFAHRVRGNERMDLLRLLQVSAERRSLTHRAQSVISNPDLQPMARAALEHVHGQWDGTVSDASGGRSWLGILHLSVNRRVSLFLSASEAPRELELGDGITANEGIAIALDKLPALAAHGLRFGNPGEAGVSLRPTGDTLVFEVSEDAGLIWVKVPLNPVVYVLSRDHDVKRTLANYLATGFGTRGLPPGWQLFERAPAERLPGHLGPQKSVTRPPVGLAGGLRLGRSWLVGFPPRVEVGEVDQPLTVQISGVLYGEVSSGGEMALRLDEGDYRVDVGDGLASFSVHMVVCNPAHARYGQLACSLDARGLRTGASIEPREPYVLGAALKAALEVSRPLLFRLSTVWLITTEGVGLRKTRPASPGWLERVGLDANAARWELDAEADIAWVLAGHSVLMLRPSAPVELNRAACRAVLAVGEHPRIRALAGTANDAEEYFATLWTLATVPGVEGP